ncbi:MAG TPA: FxsA family protein [Lacipirellula sp.]
MLRSLAGYFLLFVIAEMAALILLGRAFGVLPTILLVLGGGIAGAWLARWQGLRSAMRAREQMGAGVMPTKEMTDGLLIAVAAVLLIIPGVITDVLGLALLFPPTRALLRHFVVGQLTRRSPLGRFTHEHEHHRRTPGGGDRIIDARVIETRVVED